MGIFIAGYAVDAAVILAFLVALGYLVCCISKPKFIKYKHNEQEDKTKPKEVSPK